MSTTALSRADRQQWRAAHTLLDLAELTARWFEGDLAGCGPDEETTELAPMLALLNRAGWLTDCSQPGYVTETDEQRAACTGLLDWHQANRVSQMADSAGLVTIVTSVGRRWWVRDHKPRDRGEPRVRGARHHIWLPTTSP